MGFRKWMKVIINWQRRHSRLLTLLLLLLVTATVLLIKGEHEPIPTKNVDGKLPCELVQQLLYYLPIPSMLMLEQIINEGMS